MASSGLGNIITTALASHRWRLIIAGVSHGGGSQTSERVTRLLEAFKPSIIFVELDRRDFARFVAPRLCRFTSRVEEYSYQQLGATYFEEAVPECEAVVQWVGEKQGTRAEDYQVVSATGEQSPVCLPMDRDQLSTRRRLAYRLMQQPNQFFRARKYWGAASAPENHVGVARWRESMRAECSVLHEVLFEERDEYMAYQVLLHLSAHLAARSQSSAPRKTRVGTLQASVDSMLQERAKRESAQVNAALQWSLDGPALGAGSFLANDVWAEEAERLEQDASVERVLVLCGPAHVDGLATRLRSALGCVGCEDAHRDGGLRALEGFTDTRRFLALNSALLPQLLLSADAPGRHDRVSPFEAAQQLEQTIAACRLDIPGTSDYVQPCVSSGRFYNQTFGPLASLSSRLWVSLGGVGGENATKTRDLFSQTQPAAAKSFFVHDRLCELSRRPLPIWPAFIAAYLVLPAFVFVVVPAYVAKADLWWLARLNRPSESGEPERQTECAAAE